mmetsp:Transcript_5650/g.6826  ORF Transcript_5650/g.6826 Transcript_5650/m.6826 type:complete len:182 (-) Transcript_5650:11-556(-)|eukprot:CAMPEP_0184020600 /NCGR_PEP_ID=MMETSP0954-20121128/9441_1 /TAXON_ID=627963 /ORGANISM="Aplanochytrium sp, Strain PBS07" /LENGTH=181 /DNA_ID=CAMNT_0026302483 /DNA_START=111 /DNA_END=656 /DNA_ORIENTATION=+
MLGLNGYASSDSSSDDKEAESKEKSVAPTSLLQSKESAERVDLDKVLLNEHESIPKEPSSTCSNEVEQLFNSYFKIKKEKGIKFVDKLHANSQFDNPALLDLKIWQLEIDENCTNFPTDTWDPVSVGKVKVDVERFIPLQAHEAIVERKRKAITSKDESREERTSKLARIKAKLDKQLQKR